MHPNWRSEKEFLACILTSNSGVEAPNRKLAILLSGNALSTTDPMSPMNRRHLVTLALASSAVAAMPTPSVAADLPAKPKPSKPIGSIQDRVYRIVSQQLGVPLQQIQPQSRFVADLKADSLDLVELVMAFEEEFGVEMSDSDCAGLTTVGQTVTYLQQLTAKKAKA